MSNLFYMSRAFNLASYGKFTTTPNPNVGCVIVKNKKIVGEGWHKAVGEEHAEKNALFLAGEKAKGATVYVTLEPCIHFGNTSPCCDELIKAGIKKIYTAIIDPNPKVSGRGLKKLKKAGIKVHLGLMKKKAEYINRGFLKRMRTGLPWVQIKLAASLDGKTQMIKGENPWITSIKARRNVQFLRAQSSAILSTSKTILSDNPLLTVRWENFQKSMMKNINSYKNLRQPIRVIIDSKNLIKPNHLFLHQPGKIILVRLVLDKYIWPKNVEQLIVPVLNKKIDLNKLLMILGTKKINTLFVESGFTLAGLLIEKNLVDEVIIYFAPKLLGNNLNGLFKLPIIKKEEEIPKFFLKMYENMEKILE